jgi:hypothetical protein
MTFRGLTEQYCNGILPVLILLAGKMPALQEILGYFLNWQSLSYLKITLAIRLGIHSQGVHDFTLAIGGNIRPRGLRSSGGYSPRIGKLKLQP